ncbi:MAG: response regulator transcription factor [Gaiellaceae bacterium]
MTDITVLLVEDDSMVRDWMRTALPGAGFRIVGETASVDAVHELARRRNPDLLLVDYRLPDGRGTELVRALRKQGLDTPAVLMTANAERGFNEAARDAGAQGTFLKTGNVDELEQALRAVLGGEPAFDPRHPRRAPGRGALSPREREALRLVAEGLTNREIARKLEIGDETVKTLLGRSFAKLGARKRAEAVAVAQERGLL